MGYFIKILQIILRQSGFSRFGVLLNVGSTVLERLSVLEITILAPFSKMGDSQPHCFIFGRNFCNKKKIFQHSRRAKGQLSFAM